MSYLLLTATFQPLIASLATRSFNLLLAINASTARQTILHLQGLSAPPNRRQSRNDLYTLIESLGFVQLDSIQWVERAHHMILFARNQTYRPNHLVPLIEKDKRLFENWTHDASLIPSCFFPYWRHKFKRNKIQLNQKFANWQGGGFNNHIDILLKRIKKEGPLMSRDMEKPKRSSQPKEMWQWDDGKAALEYLWRTGKLGIKGRQNFQKIYDLIEKCLHVDDHSTTVSHGAFVEWSCRTALDRLGFGSPTDIAKFWDLLTVGEVKHWLEKQDSQSIRPVTVTGADQSTKILIARPDIQDIIETLPLMPPRARILSPFDPVIRDRKRLEWLWAFNYRIEIYVPEAKRIWGYYVFPILEKDRLIGRVDMRADRKLNALTVRKLWLEKGIKPSVARRQRIEAELLRQAKLAGVGTVDWDGCAC